MASDEFAVGDLVRLKGGSTVGRVASISERGVLQIRWPANSFRFYSPSHEYYHKRNLIRVRAAQREV